LSMIYRLCLLTMMKVTLVVGNVQTMIQEGWFKRV